MTSQEEKFTIIQAIIYLATAITGVRDMVIAAKTQDDGYFRRGSGDISKAIDSLMEQIDLLIEAARKDDVDLSLFQAEVVRLREANRAAADQPGVEPGGGGPHDPGMEPRVAKLEADVGHIRSDIGEIKTLLGWLAPCIDEMYGRQAALVTQQDLTGLRVELERRPTRRQTVFDIIAIVGFIGVLLTIGAKVGH